MKHLRTLVAGLIVCAATMGPACAQTSPKPAELFHLHVGTPATDQTMSLIYGVASGMFARAGLEVQLDHSSPNGAAIAAGVLGGSYDVGNAIVTALFDAHRRGIPFAIVGVGAVYDNRAPYSGMVVPNDSPIRTAADFRTGVVGLAILKDIGEVAIDKAVNEAGGTTKNLQFVEIPQTAGIAAVEQHRVLATELSNPMLAQALASGMRLVPDLNTFGTSFTFTTYFATKDFAAKHPDVIKTFSRVLAQAALYTNTHPAETAALLATESGISLSVIQHMPRVKNGTSVTAASIQPLIDAEAKYGYLPASFPAQELIDPNVESK